MAIKIQQRGVIRMVDVQEKSLWSNTSNFKVQLQLQLQL
jgi:hypothetical protein